jgi:hypothetical protein
MKTKMLTLVLVASFFELFPQGNGNISAGSTTYTYAGPSQYGAIGLPRGEIMFSNTNTQNQIYLMQNGYMGSSGAFLYRNASTVSSLGLDNGNIFFFTAPSGAAGQSIPLAARLVMYNNGNMTVGATSSIGIPKGRIHIGAEDASTNSAISIRQSNSDNYGFDISLDQNINGNMFLQRVVGDAKSNVLEIERNTGNIGIGTSPDARLAVRGRIHVMAEDESLSSAISIRQSNSMGFGFDIGLDQSENGNMFLHRVFGNVKYSVMEVNRNSGNIGIGTSPGSSFKLAVEGKIGAREVNVTLANPWPDYVFEKSYSLPSLEEVKSYINQNKHLPEVPSAKEIEANGVNLGEMNMLLLKKIEELTLYIIDQNKAIGAQNEKIEGLQKQIDFQRKK